MIQTSFIFPSILINGGIEATVLSFQSVLKINYVFPLKSVYFKMRNLAFHSQNILLKICPFQNE
jgi:hypothetical protein